MQYSYNSVGVCTVCSEIKETCNWEILNNNQ